MKEANTKATKGQARVGDAKILSENLEALLSAKKGVR